MLGGEKEEIWFQRGNFTPKKLCGDAMFVVVGGVQWELPLINEKFEVLMNFSILVNYKKIVLKFNYF